MADEVAWDADDFEPGTPIRGPAVTDKWEGEDEDDDVKDNWDDEEEEKADENENEQKALQVKKKKSLKERIAEKEEKRKKELEEKRRKEEEQKKAMKPMSADERASEKVRIKKEQEEADLALAMEAFGSSNSELAGTVIDTMNPISRDDFEAFEVAIKNKVLNFEKSPHYVPFLDMLFRDLSLGLEPEDLKKLGSTLNALSNEKTKQQKGTKGKKKSKKAQINAGKGTGEDFADLGDDMGAEYDDFI